MPKCERTIEVDGLVLSVPPYLNRTRVGWQARVRGVPSQHFADSQFGDPSLSLRAASEAVEPMIQARLRAQIAAQNQ